MEARPVNHPSADALRAFALGKLDDSTASVLMSHLDGCPDCCKAVAALSGDDFRPYVLRRGLTGTQYLTDPAYPHTAGRRE